MVRHLLPWRCILVMFCAVMFGASVSGATFFVGSKRIPNNPGGAFYWNPTNVVINAGDTVMWTNLQSIHSVNPATGSPEPFCGTGTNEIPSCTVTFLNPGTFPYDCYQHLPTMTGAVVVLPPLVPPVVMITNLPNNSVVRTGANVTLQVQATDNGAVTNVQFLRGGIPFATNTLPPYAATWSNIAAGSHSFRARATDNEGLVADSALVTVRAVVPPTLLVTNTSNGLLRFSFNTVANVGYVVEGAVTLTNFAPIVTNAGTGAAQQFTETNPAPAQKFFRLRLQ
jgi:plastocyanin